MARRTGIAHRVIETSLDILEEDETRRRIALVLASPELRAAIEAICESAARGALDALDEERTARLTALGVEASTVLTAVAVEQVAPALARVAAEVLSDGLAPLRDPERQHEIERMVHISPERRRDRRRRA